MPTPTLPGKEPIDFAKLGDKSRKLWRKLIDGGTPVECSNLKCTNVSTTYCPTCHVIAYCSDKCFESDFKPHFKKCLGRERQWNWSCQVSNLGEDEEGAEPRLEVFAFTTAGSVAFVEEVELIFPRLPQDYLNFASGRDEPIIKLKMACFGCHTHFYLSEGVTTCSGCNLICCGSACPNHYHSRYECQVLRKFRSQNVYFWQKEITTPRKYVELFMDLCVLRVLSYFANGKSQAHVAAKWKKFLAHSQTNRFKMFKKTTLDPFDGVAYLKVIKSVEVLKFSLAYASNDRDIIGQVYRILVAFWEELEVPCGTMSRVFYPLRNFMMHRYCSPNTRMASSMAKDTTTSVHSKPYPLLYFYATERLEPQSEYHPVPLTFDFSPRHFMPHPLRMIYLNDRGFSCSSGELYLIKCTLCEDPTDGGTHSGSIRCLRCYEGLYTEGEARGKDLLLDAFPKRWTLDYVKNVDWKCTLCSDTQPFSFILETNVKIEEHYRNLKRNPRWNAITDGANFIDYYENAYLHPTNGIILQAKFEVLMASRRKHLKECGLDRNAQPIIKVRDEENFVRENFRMFPVKWNEDELYLVQKRVGYADDCKKYLAMTKYKPVNWTSQSVGLEFPFLKLEHAVMGFLLACYHFSMDWSKSSELKFGKARKMVLQTIDEWNLTKVLLDYKRLESCVLFKYPKVLNVTAKLMSNQKSELWIVELILKSMRSNLDQFTMGYGAGDLMMRQLRLEKWPMVKENPGADSFDTLVSAHQNSDLFPEKITPICSINRVERKIKVVRFANDSDLKATKHTIKLTKPKQD